MHIASLILGILSMFLFFIPGIGLILSLIGLILAILSHNKFKKERKTSKIVIGGLVISLIGLTLSLIITGYTVIGIMQAVSYGIGSIFY